MENIQNNSNEQGQINQKSTKEQKKQSKKKISSLDKLKKQRGVINARIQKAEALEKSRERKKNTRQKILVGAYYLDKAKENNSMDEIYKLMNDYLTRESDRALFELDNESK